MDTVRVGFIGCGNVAFRHAVQLAEIEDARVVAVADPSNASRTRFYDFAHPILERVLAEDPSLSDPVETARRSAQDADYFEEYTHMLESARLDAVVVESPHKFRRQQIADALDMGLHVLVEKPMVTSADEAAEVIELAKERDCVLAVGYHRHFVPEFQYMREVIQHGGLGDVLSVSYLLYQNWYGTAEETWRADPDLAAGGHLIDTGSHIVDAVLWVTEMNVASIFAQIDNLDLDVDVNSVLTVNFSNGALGDIALIGQTSLPFGEELTISGSEGAFLYRQGEFCHVDADGEAIDLELPMPTSNCDRNFIDAILGRDTLEIDGGQCALRVARLTDAAYKSARTEKLVPVR